VSQVPLKVASSGVDALHLSVRGAVRGEVWEAVEEAKLHAQEGEESVPFTFPLTGQAFLVKPHGLRGHAYWLTSPDFELALGRSKRTAVVQLHSAYLHSMGSHAALDLVEQLLRLEVFAEPPAITVSRVDVYADSQGWDLELNDLRRFVCLGRARKAFNEHDQAFAWGRRLTGFMFGRDAVVARLYDKTAEIRGRGVSWLPDLWSNAHESIAVWRLEFQFRRRVLVEFHLRTVDEILAGLQDLWTYATGCWLSFRTPTTDGRERRWPVDPLWDEVRAVRITPTSLGVVIRRRLEEATEERLLRGSLGYLSSWAALRDWPELETALRGAGPILERHLAAHGRTFRAEVRRKRARLMNVTSFLDGHGDAGERMAGPGPRRRGGGPH
jgi:hypothetical protein